MKEIIAIDHGNYSIKTETQQFVAGLSVSDYRPPVGECILYGDRYYTLTEKRMPYRHDKTETEEYFILTLFAIAKELRARGIGSEQDILLAVCLPPQHFGSMREAFAQYFHDHDLAEFEYNGERFDIYIEDVYVYPQAYAAAYLRYEELAALGSVFLVDIGGYTVDVLKLRYGKPDMQFCLSLNKGAILLFNDIKTRYSAQYDLTLDDHHIEDILNGSSLLDNDLIIAIENDARAYIEDVIRQLREREIDLIANSSMFMGGGSILFKPFIEQSRIVNAPLFELSPNANAKGCKGLAKAQYMKMANEGAAGGTV